MRFSVFTALLAATVFFAVISASGADPISPSGSPPVAPASGSTIWIDIYAFLKIPACAFMGAFMLYVLNRHNDKEPLSLLKALNMNVGAAGSPGLILVDMLLSSILGATVVTMITSPTTVTQGVTAGLGMTGILAAATKDK